MIRESADPLLLAELAIESTSCGRYQRYGLQHCGRCLPCSVRRAAFLAAGLADTTSYRYEDLRKYVGADLEDLRAIARARIQVQDQGLDRWIGNALNSPHIRNADALRAMLNAINLENGFRLVLRYSVGHGAWRRQRTSKVRTGIDRDRG